MKRQSLVCHYNENVKETGNKGHQYKENFKYSEILYLINRLQVPKI